MVRKRNLQFFSFYLRFAASIGLCSFDKRSAMKTRLLKPLFLAFFSLTVANAATAGNNQMIKETPSTWIDLASLPGAQYSILVGNPEKSGFFVVRVKIPPNTTIAPHYHLIDEYDTVISGAYYLGTGKEANTKKRIALKQGAFVKIPAKTVHYGFAQEETILQVSGMGPWSTIYL